MQPAKLIWCIGHQKLPVQLTVNSLTYCNFSWLFVQMCQWCHVKELHQSVHVQYGEVVVRGIRLGDCFGRKYAESIKQGKIGLRVLLIVNEDLHKPTTLDDIEQSLRTSLHYIRMSYGTHHENLNKDTRSSTIPAAIVQRCSFGGLYTSARCDRMAFLSFFAGHMTAVAGWIGLRAGRLHHSIYNSIIYAVVCTTYIRQFRQNTPLKVVFCCCFQLVANNISMKYLLRSLLLAIQTIMDQILIACITFTIRSTTCWR